MGKKRINATHYEDIPAFPSSGSADDTVVNAIIETPKLSRHKYALKSDYGIISFRETMPAGLQWPFDYGFVPRTLAADGDPLDILVITDNGLFPGCLIEVRVLGAVRELKDGVENDRLIAVPLPSAGAPEPTDAYREITDVPEEMRDGIRDFLKGYSERQGHAIEVTGIVDAAGAMQLVKTAMRAFKKGS